MKEFINQTETQWMTGEEPMMKKMMGKDYGKFFTEEDEEELKEQAMDEYRLDAKLGMI